jgi:hypothetical protein
MESVLRPDLGRLLASPWLPGHNGDETLAALRTGRPPHEVEPAFRQMARALPPEQVGEAAFVHWLINAADRHFNNYLWSPTRVIPIDYGYSLWPRSDTRYQWDRLLDALRGVPDFPDDQWADIPIPRAVLEAAVVNMGGILTLVEEHAGRHHGWLQWLTGHGCRRVVEGFRRKLERVRDRISHRSVVMLGDLGIEGRDAPPDG